MTDKQIIMNGVDVSGCKNLMQGIVPFGCMEDRKTCSCMNNPNCLYKQLKRTEAQCEEMFVKHTDLEMKYKRKEQELEQVNKAYEACKESRLKAYNKLQEKEKECNELKYELRTERKDNKYIKKWCIEAGEELEKNSFAWDGKEKNLVIQAMELNERFEAKKQECEELKKDLRRSFKEKDTLHLIIDRLLEASGYDTNTASAEDFEDVYEHMRCEQQQLDQLKAENKDLKIYIESNEQQVKEVETLVMDNDRLINELDKLKAENEKLKYDNEYEVGALEKTIDNLKAELEQYKWERIKNSPSATKEQISEKIEADIASDRRSNDE